MHSLISLNLFKIIIFFFNKRLIDIALNIKVEIIIMQIHNLCQQVLQYNVINVLL